MDFREILFRAEEKMEAEKEATQANAVQQRAEVVDTSISDQKEKTMADAEQTLAAEHNFFWRMEDLKLVKVKNQRAFFRLETNLDAAIISLDKFRNKEEFAKVLNISVNGVGVGTTYPCCVGDKLLLKVCLASPWEEENLLCRVMRIEEKGVSGFVYGCQFMDQDEKDREHMLQKLLELEQRMRG